MKQIVIPIVIIGAGPTGLLLQRMLYNRGIESLILENRNESYLRSLSRPSIVDGDTVELLKREKIGSPFLEVKKDLDAMCIRFDGKSHLLPYQERKSYSEQNVITGSLIDRNKEAGLKILWEGKGQRFEGLEEDEVTVHYTLDARLHKLKCQYVVGCDGYFGISRSYIAEDQRREEKVQFPYSWYEIKIASTPQFESETCSIHTDGLVIQTWAGTDHTRYFVQCENGTNPEDWSDDHILSLLNKRLSQGIHANEIIERKVHTMMTMTSQKLQRGRLFIAGEAAHVVPLIGSKGMNQSLRNVQLLAEGFDAKFNQSDALKLENYTNEALPKVAATAKLTHQLFDCFHSRSEWDLERATRLLSRDYDT